MSDTLNPSDRAAHPGKSWSAPYTRYDKGLLKHLRALSARGWAKMTIEERRLYLAFKRRMAHVR
jgi:hypothetical protein